jgi:transposase-like protein
VSDLSNPIFHNETKAREWLELELWPTGPVCPHCGTVDEATLMQGKSHRPGLYQCNSCREPFTVTVGTLYERSKVPLNKWLAATHLLMASKKGMSALQIGRLLGLSKKTAWFLCHRIRESLREINPDMLGGEGKIVEFDETFVGGKERNKHASKRNKKNIGGRGKEAVFSLVERGGKVRSHHVTDVSAKTLRPILEAQIREATKTMSDDGGSRPGHDRPQHQSVNHSIGEYVRGEAHTNTIEGYFSIMKRGINGVYPMNTGRTTSSRSRNKQPRKKAAKTEAVELRPDGWDRFRAAVGAAAISGPKPRPAKPAKKAKH